VVAELAVQIKDRTSNRGAPRIYAALLGDGRPGLPADVLPFLALCLRSVDPSPRYVRELTRQLFERALTEEVTPVDLAGSEVAGFINLIQNYGSYRDLVADEIGKEIDDTIRSGQQELMVNGLRLVAAMPALTSLFGAHDQNYWPSRTRQLIMTHRAATVAAAETDAYVRDFALRVGLIGLRQALNMPGGPAVLFHEASGWASARIPYFTSALCALDGGWPAFGDPAIVDRFTAFGEYLADNPETPWLYDEVAEWQTYFGGPLFAGKPVQLSQAAYLGAAAILSIMAETGQLPTRAGRKLGPLRPVAAYVNRRQGRGRRAKLPELRVPDEFKPVFREWADGAINFVAPG
jgi:hypothetical protein